MEKDRVLVFDTTLRDGEQALRFSMNVEEKVRLARQLVAAVPVPAAQRQAMGADGLIATPPGLGCPAVPAKFPADRTVMAA